MAEWEPVQAFELMEGLMGHSGGTGCCCAQVLVAEGEPVEAGAPLVVLEAMKMEHTVAAPCAGVVSQLGAHAGAQVSDGELLAVVAPAAAAAEAAAAG